MPGPPRCFPRLPRPRRARSTSTTTSPFTSRLAKVLGQRRQACRARLPRSAWSVRGRRRPAGQAQDRCHVGQQRRQPLGAFVEDQRRLHRRQGRPESRAGPTWRRGESRRRGSGRTAGPTRSARRSRRRGRGRRSSAGRLPPPRGQVRTPGRRSAASPPRRHRRRFAPRQSAPSSRCSSAVAAVVVIGDHLAPAQRDAMDLHQVPQRAGILGHQHIGPGQHIKRPQRDVAGRADRRRDEMQPRRNGAQAGRWPVWDGSAACLTSLHPFPNPLP